MYTHDTHGSGPDIPESQDRLTPGAVVERLRTVDDPRLDGDVVALGLVAFVSVDPATITVGIGLYAPGAPDEREIAASIHEALAGYDREVRLLVSPPAARPAAPSVPGVRNLVVVAGAGEARPDAVARTLAAGVRARGLDASALRVETADDAAEAADERGIRSRIRRQLDDPGSEGVDYLLASVGGVDPDVAAAFDAVAAPVGAVTVVRGGVSADHPPPTTFESELTPLGLVETDGDGTPERGIWITGETTPVAPSIPGDSPGNSPAEDPSADSTSAFLDAVGCLRRSRRASLA